MIPITDGVNMFINVTIQFKACVLFGSIREREMSQLVQHTLSPRHQMWQIIKLISVMLVPILALVIIAAVNLSVAIKDNRK